MPHQPYHAWMQATLDMTLTPEKQRQLHAHLAVCGDCRAHWDGLLTAARMLKQKPLATPAGDFQQRWQAKLQAYRTRPQLRWRAVALGAGAVSSAALVMPVGLGVLNALARVSQQPSTWSVFNTNLTATSTHLAALFNALFIMARASGVEWAGGFLALLGGSLLVLLAFGCYLLWRQGWARCQS